MTSLISLVFWIWKWTEYWGKLFLTYNFWPFPNTKMCQITRSFINWRDYWIGQKRTRELLKGIRNLTENRLHFSESVNSNYKLPYSFSSNNHPFQCLHVRLRLFLIFSSEYHQEKKWLIYRKYFIITAFFLISITLFCSLYCYYILSRLRILSRFCLLPRSSSAKFFKLTKEKWSGEKRIRAKLLLLKWVLWIFIFMRE